MSRLFRNDSPGALTREQAVALMKERIAAQAGGGPGHDVSREPRVPKGSGDESGEWTTGGSASVPTDGNSAHRDNRRMSVAGRAFLKAQEGHRDKPYDDGYGNMTQGYGNKGPLTGSAEDSFNIKVAEADEAVNKNVKVPLTQAQHDALVSLAYNLGPNGFANSPILLGLLNAGKFDEAADQILQFKNAFNRHTGRMEFSQSLADRRKRERLLFLGNSAR